MARGGKPGRGADQGHAQARARCAGLSPSCAPCTGPLPPAEPTPCAGIGETGGAGRAQAHLWEHQPDAGGSSDPGTWGDTSQNLPLWLPAVGERPTGPPLAPGHATGAPRPRPLGFQSWTVTAAGQVHLCPLGRTGEALAMLPLVRETRAALGRVSCPGTLLSAPDTQPQEVAPAGRDAGQGRAQGREPWSRATVPHARPSEDDGTLPLTSRGRERARAKALVYLTFQRPTPRDQPSGDKAWI